MVVWNYFFFFTKDIQYLFSKWAVTHILRILSKKTGSHFQKQISDCEKNIYHFSKQVSRSKWSVTHIEFPRCLPDKLEYPDVCLTNLISQMFSWQTWASRCLPELESHEVYLTNLSPQMSAIKRAPWLGDQWLMWPLVNKVKNRILCVWRDGQFYKMTD